jgi:sulfatase maturation enzyme AslB (radical SAM superfamily)
MIKKLLKKPYEYMRFLQFKQSPAKSLKSLHIQLCNLCNLQCQWCSFVNPEKKEFISLELLTKLFDEITNNKKFKIKEINLWNGGEALLHPQFRTIMERIRNYRDKNKDFPKVKLLTNTTLLNKKISEDIIKIGAIDSIGFSIDGGSKEEFEKIREGAKFEVIKKNIEYFIKLNNGRISTMINCIVPFAHSLDDSWMSEEFREILSLVDYYKLNYLVNNGGKIFIDYPVGFKFLKTNKRFCLALIQGLVVIQNGDVLFCCNDFNGDHVLGNLNKQSLYELANSPARKELVQIYYERGKEAILLCSTCNRFSIPFKIWKNSQSKEKNDKGS